MKIFRFAFTGLLTGFILALIADRSVWIEMRINTGFFLPMATGLAITTGIVSNGRVPRKIS